MHPARNFEFDLSSARLVPLYAVPSLGTSALNMMLRTERETAQFTFLDFKNFWKLQHALTGFEVYK